MKRNTISSPWRNCLVVVLILALIYSCLTQFFGIELHDTFYFITRFQTSEYVSLFLPLTQGLFLASQHLFGNYVIVSRLVNWFIFTASCMLGLCYLRREQPHQWLILLGVIFAVLSLPTVDFTTAFNGNALSLLFVTLLLLCLYRYFQTNRTAVLASVAVCIALLPLVRFPNIVVVVFILLITPLLCSNIKAYGHIVLSVGVGMILYLIIGSLIFGGVQSFVHTLMTTLTASNQTGASHSMAFLMKEYLHSLKDMLSFDKWLSLSAIIPLGAYFTTSRRQRLVLILLYAIAMITIVALRVRVDSWFFPFFACTIVVFLNILQCMLAWVRGDMTAFAYGLLPIAMGLTCVAGSDTGLTLLSAPMFVFLPFTLMQLSQSIQAANKNDMAWVIIALIGFALFCFLYCRTDTQLISIVYLPLLLITIFLLRKRPIHFLDTIAFASALTTLRTALLIGLTTGIGLIVFARFYWHAGEQRTICQTVYAFSYPQLKGVRAGQDQVEWVETVMAEYEQCEQSKNVLFYGMPAAIFTYLSGVDAITELDFSCEENEHNLSLLVKALETLPTIFLCPASPGRPMYLLNDYPKIDSLLIQRGYTKHIHTLTDPKASFAVYTPPHKKTTIEYGN